MADLYRFRIPAAALVLQVGVIIRRALTPGETARLCEIALGDDAVAFVAEGPDVVVRPGPALVAFLAEVMAPAPTPAAAAVDRHPE